MNIEVSPKIEREEWDRIVTEDESVSFFHTAEWSDVLTSTLPGFEPAHLTARMDGRLVAGVPVLRRSRLSATTLESMAFGTFGGPVVAAQAPRGAASELLTEFAALSASPRVGFAQVVDRAGRVEAGDLPGFERVEDSVQVVRLDRPYEELESGFKPSSRNKKRKALKAGVAVRRATTEDDFLAYHAVLEECSADWDVRVKLSPDFFAALSRLDPDRVQMWLAVHDGDVIGGDLNFALHGVVMNWGNVSRPRAKSLAPNNLLHANAIERGVADGQSVYDLGSSAGIEGVRAFKASFGTEDVPVVRYVRQKSWYRAARKLAGR